MAVNGTRLPVTIMQPRVRSAADRSSRNTSSATQRVIDENRVRMTITSATEPLKVYELEIWRKQTEARNAHPNSRRCSPPTRVIWPP